MTPVHSHLRSPPLPSRCDPDGGAEGRQWQRTYSCRTWVESFLMFSGIFRIQPCGMMLQAVERTIRWLDSNDSPVLTKMQPEPLFFGELWKRKILNAQEIYTNIYFFHHYNQLYLFFIILRALQHCKSKVSYRSMKHPFFCASFPICFLIFSIDLGDHTDSNTLHCQSKQRIISIL